VENQVDYYAVSFVKDAQVVHELKDYLRSNVYSILHKKYVGIVLTVS
jgi:pyruvate kinase